MKKIKIIIMGLLFVILAICIAGCTTQTTPQQSSEISDTVAQTTNPTISETIVQITETTTTSTITTPTQIAYSNEDINNHFLSLAFGRTNYYLEKVTTGSAHKILFTLKGQSTDEDHSFITNFARDYNQFTQTETFHKPARIQTDDDPWSISINFYPSTYLESLHEGKIRYKKVDPNNDEYLYIVTSSSPPQYYINSNLSGDKRNHFIMSATFDYLGFPGETYNYPDSFFYFDNWDKIKLSSLDKAAINIMYKPLLYRGMSIEDVKSSLATET